MTKKRNVGAEILEGIRQIKSGKSGRVSTIPSVAGIRGRHAGDCSCRIVPQGSYV